VCCSIGRGIEVPDVTAELRGFNAKLSADNGVGFDIAESSLSSSDRLRMTSVKFCRIPGRLPILVYVKGFRIWGVEEMVEPPISENWQTGRSRTICIPNIGRR